MIIKEVMKVFHGKGFTFEESLWALKETDIKNQKVLRVILTAIGRHYTSSIGALKKQKSPSHGNAKGPITKQ